LEEEDPLVSRSKIITHSNLSYKNDTGTNLLIYPTSLKTSKMFNTVEKLMRLLKSETYFPRPVGQWEVGYIDIMTEGQPEDSSFIRLYYPTMQKHEFLPERCPIWTEHDTKHGFINFMHAMLKRWPSWVNDSEFIIKGIMDPIENLCSWAFKPLFAMGWEVLAKNPRIPVIHQAQLAKGQKFPMVVFSHGMGCNRYAYSKVCYDLCSEGFFVAAVEHREGSACHSRFNVSGKFIEIPHMYLADEDHEYEQRNKQVHQRAKEVTLAMDLVSSLNMGTTPNNVLNQEYGYDLANFVGRIDTEDCYLVGHSFGGATVLLAADRDDRFKGIVSIDPWMFSLCQEKFRVNKPVLMINTEHFVNKENLKKVREICSDLIARVLPGAVHLVHTDAPLLFENDRVKSGLGMRCSRTSEEVLAENHFLVHTFIQSRMSGAEIERS